MNNINTKQKQSLYIILITLILAFYYYASFTYPICGDDFEYRFVITQPRLVENLPDIIESQIAHRNVCNGRFVTHCLVQAFLLVDKYIFAIANTIIYATSCILIAKLIFKQNFTEGLLLVTASFWFLMPSPGGTMFWLTGAFNYCWCAFWGILFISLLTSDNTKKIFGALLLAPFVGNAHESLSVGIIVIAFTYAFFKRKTSFLYWATCIFLIAGFFTNVLSPGNFRRLESTTEITSGVLPTIWKYCIYLMKVGYRLILNWSEPNIPILTCCWVTTASVCWRQFKKGNKVAYILPTCFCLGALCTLSLNLLSGFTYTRSVFAFCFFAYIGILYTMILTEKLHKAIVILFLILNFFTIPLACQDINILHKTMLKAKQTVLNKETITIAPQGWERLETSRYADKGIEPNTLANNHFKKYYNIEDIAILTTKQSQIIDQNKETLKNLSPHTSITLNNQLQFVRLKGKPKQIEISVSDTPDDSSAHYWKKFKRWMRKHKRLPEPCYVINYNGVYYSFWIYEHNTIKTLKISYQETNTSPIIINNL